MKYFGYAQCARCRNTEGPWILENSKFLCEKCYEKEKKVMNNAEVNKRAKEVEKELQEMKESWIKIYDLLTKLIDDTKMEE